MRALGLLLSCLLLLSACGDETADPGSDDRTGEEQPTATPTTRTAPEVVALLHATAAGGSTDLPASRIDEPDGLEWFLDTLDEGQLRTDVEAEVEKHGDDPRRLYAEVVMIGCDVPDSVHAEVDDSALLLHPAKIANPMRECLAPVTTVAVVAVDDAWFQE